MSPGPQDDYLDVETESIRNACDGFLQTQVRIGYGRSNGMSTTITLLSAGIAGQLIVVCLFSAP